MLFSEMFLQSHVVKIVLSILGASPVANVASFVVVSAMFIEFVARVKSCFAKLASGMTGESGLCLRTKDIITDFLMSFQFRLAV